MSPGWLVAYALECVGGRGFQQFARLRVAQRRRAAFVAVGHGPFHPVHRVAGDSIAFAKSEDNAESLRRIVAGTKPRLSMSLRQAMICGRTTDRSPM